MERRKIQLIAGTTYSVSLPKQWVVKNNLKEKSEITFLEKDDRTLLLSSSPVFQKEKNEIKLNIDDHLGNIDQMLFTLYYLGIENISLFSKKGLSKESELRIRRSLRHMSGTEISYEDSHSVIIKVLLDKSKVDIMQIIYRISLIIKSSVSNLIDNKNIDEIKMNENEIDRLYHLLIKMISLSLTDSDILKSSKINNVSLIPYYFLIGKKLENIADNIENISQHLADAKKRFEDRDKTLGTLVEELNRSITHLIGDNKAIFEKTQEPKLKGINNKILKSKDTIIMSNLLEISRYIVDIQEDIINISFYRKLVHEGSI